MLIYLKRLLQSNISVQQLSEVGVIPTKQSRYVGKWDLKVKEDMEC